ncbi:hypothetical protein F441_01132 [Phytophthora nicotianae CJ01A1]|uniref:Uncharacterized protein n=1 Tax=Phytophthora nicotianae CJ01A1 TaxID=1317063 RepID=W2XW17_PHYNI|nr:hypothetical protein F441_01132 [Phytophthora nicotianae CJ01A1]
MEADAKFFWKNVAQVKEELGVEKVYNADQSGIMKTWKNLGAHVIKSGFAGLLKCRSGGNPDEPDDTQEPTSVEPVNELVEELERLNAVEDPVSDSDDMFERYSDDDVEAE